MSNLNPSSIKKDESSSSASSAPSSNSINIQRDRDDISTTTAATINGLNNLQLNGGNTTNVATGLKTHFGSPLRTLIRASSLQNLPSHGSSSKDLEVATSALKNSAVMTPSTTKDKMDLIKYEPDSVHPGPSSKYDFVKVKVRLEDHYYVLSRFLISRVLNVTQVDAADSVKISLELKKRLVDQGRLTLTQAELENELFTLLQSYGYGSEYIERYRMTTQFHHQRVPLIILISGAKCIGKSWLATQLAERLNLSTVLQTTLVQDLMDAIIKEFPNPNGKLFGMPSDPPIIFKNYNSREELVADYKKECAMIRHGVDTDIEKCFDEGKAIIIEGPHIDPALFKELIMERTMTVPLHINDNNNIVHNENNLNNNINNNSNNSSENNSINNNSNNINNSGNTISVEINNNNDSTTSNQTVQTTSTTTTTTAANLTTTNQTLSTSSSSSPTTASLAAKLKPKTKGIIIPFVLSMKESDHSLLVENWLSCSPVDAEYAKKSFGNDPRTQSIKVVENLQTIQNYLCQGVPPFQLVEVNAHNLLETLDVLHSAVLKRINDAYSGHVKGFEYES